MKKFITSLITLLIVGSTYGQILFIDEPSLCFDWGLKSLINNDLIHSVKINDNSYYVLSYAPEKHERPYYGDYKFERNLYLFFVEFTGKKPNGADSLTYNIASPVLQTDYKQYVDGIVSYRCYVGQKDNQTFFIGYSGYMKKLENGNIEIRLVNVLNECQDLTKHDHNMKPYYVTYILTPRKNDKSSTIYFNIREQKVW